MTVKDISIDTIGLSTRARNALHQAQVHTVGEMMEYTEGSLSQVANLGQKSVREILAKIEEYRTLEGSPESEQAQPEMTEDFEVWMQGPSGREQILSWLQETEVRVEALELLSAREFNLLLLSGNPFLHQIAFRAEQELMEIPRMDLDSARNIVRHSAQYIRDHRDGIARFLQERTKASQPPITMMDMLRMPEYRDRIGTFVQHNDICVTGFHRIRSTLWFLMPLSSIRKPLPVTGLLKSGLPLRCPRMCLTALTMHSKAAAKIC